MPRQGVPYPSREICSLKCQIDALQRQINELMKSINGVQGDGQGNVSLISGDPAIVINNDASQNQIEIALDQSELPAAAVSSVNSQTGAVQLEADDIPSDGNSDVQADIDALKALGVNLQGAINNEVTARGNADAALQGNINTVQASIPGEAANAVANDPTVIQLATDVPNKLDKITSGSSLKAYTHTGATQGEKSVVDGTTADSIAIRDANGRLQAADPASGATDKTLVTANWVSQSGAGAPNNLMHTNGNETADGVKTYNDPMFMFHNFYQHGSGSNATTWHKICKVVYGAGRQSYIRVYGVRDGNYQNIATVYVRNTSTPVLKVVNQYRIGNGKLEFKLTVDSDNVGILWCTCNLAYMAVRSIIEIEYDYGNAVNNNLVMEINAGSFTLADVEAAGTVTNATYFEEVTS